MKILLDFITFKWQTGAGEYARRVYRALMLKIEEEALPDVQIYALYDSTVGIAYSDMQAGTDMTRKIVYLDTALCKITELVDAYSIDVLFIACAQYLGGYQELQKVKCRVISVIHDLAYEEMFVNRMDYYFKIINPKYQLGECDVPVRKYWQITLKIVKWFLNVRRHHKMEKGLSLLKPVVDLLQLNEKTQIITVSEYTRQSLWYNYGISPDRVKVLYSPERIFVDPSEQPENKDLAELIRDGKKYYLMLSANRNPKNPHKAVSAFKRFAELHADVFFLTIGYPNKMFDRLLNPSYLSDSDLALALRHCYALVYPTFFEGFGYPAIEAMHYGKPVLISNTTSLPEVFGDAPIYFSPLYETEIFNALTKLTEENYMDYTEKSKRQYAAIRERQEHDMDQLIAMIIHA